MNAHIGTTTRNGTAKIAGAPGRAGELRYSRNIWPGLILTAGIAGTSLTLQQFPWLSMFSPMILAIILAIGFQNLIGAPSNAKAGVAFALRKVLRFAIALLGLQLTVEQVMEIGATGIGVIALTLVGAFLFTIWFGRMLKVERKLCQLIAAGTSICGASAVLATNAVIGAQDEDVAYAVACVTVFGSIAMFFYPLLPGLLRLDPHAYGLWAGASIHEIAQVVAAAFQDGRQAGEFGAIAKLSRVMLLAPTVMALSVMASLRSQRDCNAHISSKAPIPWFVFGFVALVGVNSVISLPVEAKRAFVTATVFFLSMGLAAMGLETNIAGLRAKGLRPALLGFAAFLFIASFSLLLVKITS